MPNRRRSPKESARAHRGALGRARRAIPGQSKEKRKQGRQISRRRSRQIHTTTPWQRPWRGPRPQILMSHLDRAGTTKFVNLIKDVTLTQLHTLRQCDTSGYSQTKLIITSKAIVHLPNQIINTCRAHCNMCCNSVLSTSFKFGRGRAYNKFTVPCTVGATDGGRKAYLSPQEFPNQCMARMRLARALF